MTRDFLAEPGNELLFTEELSPGWYLDIYGGRESVGFDTGLPVAYLNVEGPEGGAIRIQLWVRMGRVWAHYLSSCCGAILLAHLLDDLHCGSCDQAFPSSQWATWEEWAEDEKWVRTMERNLSPLADPLLAASLVAATRGRTSIIAAHLGSEGAVHG